MDSLQYCNCIRVHMLFVLVRNVKKIVVVDFHFYGIDEFCRKCICTEITNSHKLPQFGNEYTMNDMYNYSTYIYKSC